MGVNSLPKTAVTRQRFGCDLNPGLSAPESSTLTTRLPSHPLCIDQCRVKVGAIDAAALGPFKKWAHGHGREKDVFSILIVISLVGTISGKSLKPLPPALPQTP